MDLGLVGLRVLVTAGANGIGLNIARAFESEGAKVHICDIDTGALADLASTNPTITSSKIDVSDRKQVSKLFEEALDQLGGLDALINNAGIVGDAPFEDMVAERFEPLLDVHLRGAFHVTRPAWKVRPARSTWLS